MVALLENWTRASNKDDHAPEHNVLARMLNFRRYGFRHASLQTVVNEAISSGRPLELEPGTVYSLSEPLAVSNVRRFHLIGNGSTLRATADMDCLLDLNGIADSSIEGIDLTTADNVTVQDMVRYRWDGQVARSTVNNRFSGVCIGGRYVNGWRIGEPDSSVQCDTTLFTGCRTAGGWSAGETELWQRGLIVGAGVHANNMLHTFLACATYQHRVHYEIAASRYVTIGAGCNGSTSAIDVLTNAARPIALDGYRSENGAVLLKADAGHATYPMLVSIRDCGFHPTADTMGAGGAVIEVNYGGVLRITNLAASPLPADTVLVRGTALQRPLFVDVCGAVMDTPVAGRIVGDGITAREFGQVELASGGAIAE